MSDRKKFERFISSTLNWPLERSGEHYLDKRTRGAFKVWKSRADRIAELESKVAELEGENETYQEQYAAVSDLADSMRDELEQVTAENERMKKNVYFAIPRQEIGDFNITLQTIWREGKALYTTQENE